MPPAATAFAIMRKQGAGERLDPTLRNVAGVSSNLKSACFG